MHESVRRDLAHLIARRTGRRDLVRWAEAFDGNCDRFYRVAAEGNLDGLRRLREGTCPWASSAYVAAASGGHLDVIKWLRAEGCPWCPMTAPGLAAEGGHLHVLQWMRAEGLLEDFQGPGVGDHVACHMAAHGGHLHILKWLRAEGCSLGHLAHVFAAKSGHLHVLRWMWTGGLLVSNKTYQVGEYAAENGHLPILKWLHEQECPWNKCRCWDRALENGQFVIMEYIGSLGEDISCG